MEAEAACAFFYPSQTAYLTVFCHQLALQLRLPRPVRQNTTGDPDRKKYEDFSGFSDWERGQTLVFVDENRNIKAKPWIGQYWYEMYE